MMARERHPGQRNSLDALCKRYGVDNSGRELHGALLDSEILADVYLTMTGGQTSLSLAGNASDGAMVRRRRGQLRHGNPPSAGRSQADADHPRQREDLAEHARLEAIAKSAGAPALWTQLTQQAERS
jgi:DNA polymerase-3 subunit epsilon